MNAVTKKRLVHSSVAVGLATLRAPNRSPAVARFVAYVTHAFTTHARSHAHRHPVVYRRACLQLLDGGEILDAVAGLHSYTEHDAREITTAVLRALQHAHDDAGCVHRDLKPEKLLMSRDPSGAAPLGIGQRVKVAGWGRSKRLPPSGVVPGEFCFGNRGEM